MGFNCRGYASASVGFGPSENELQSDGERIKVDGHGPWKAVRHTCVSARLVAGECGPGTESTSSGVGEGTSNAIL